MNESLNKKALFYGSCFALITTGFTFSIRAGILPQLGAEFGLSAEQLGFINSMWFLGFPISMVIGGLVYQSVGPKNIMSVAFIAHTLGIVLTIYAGGYSALLISTLLIGIGNGCTEAACNPMIADMYSGVKMNKMLNRFHMWFPGGILLGALISRFMTDVGFNWEVQMWFIMVPAVIYAVLFFGKNFPKPQVEEAASLLLNLKAMLSPLYIFLILCMALTGITEFGPSQWVKIILGSSGADPMLILALTAGLVAFLRALRWLRSVAVGRPARLRADSVGPQSSGTARQGDRDRRRAGFRSGALALLIHQRARRALPTANCTVHRR